MYTVYVLYSRAFDKCYVGYTSDLSSRLRSHNELGTSNWTKRYRPWELIFKEEYSTKIAAMKREKELKSGVGREFIRKNILKDKWIVCCPLSAAADTHSSPSRYSEPLIRNVLGVFVYGGQYGGHFFQQKAKKLAATPIYPTPG